MTKLACAVLGIWCTTPAAPIHKYVHDVMSCTIDERIVLVQAPNLYECKMEKR